MLWVEITSILYSNGFVEQFPAKAQSRSRFSVVRCNEIGQQLSYVLFLLRTEAFFALTWVLFLLRSPEVLWNGWWQLFLGWEVRLWMQTLSEIISTLLFFFWNAKIEKKNPSGLSKKIYPHQNTCRERADTFLGKWECLSNLKLRDVFFQIFTVFRSYTS